MSKVALITGASGMDAIILSRFLLNKNYKIFATTRRSAREQRAEVLKLLKNNNYKLLEADITDFSSIVRSIKHSNPDEVYLLAAQSQVGTSFDQPLTTIDITGMGTANCLEAIRENKPDSRVYIACSSEQFGDTHNGEPLNEDSPMIPRSPYAAAKLLSYNLGRIYRASSGMYISCGLLFNHECELRNKYFVTRKITNGVARIKAGLDTHIELGNLDSGRDWGHSADYMRAAWMMLQADTPDDYVVAMGTFNTIEDLLIAAFSEVGIDDWKPYIRQNPKWMRPHDVTRLIGDSSKIREKLGWKPEYTFERMIKEMVQHDIDLLRTVRYS